MGVYKIHHGAGRVSYFTEPAILYLASTVMGEAEAHNRGGGVTVWPRGQDHLPEKKYCIDQPIGECKTNFLMVMIIIHIAYITCLVTSDAWHIYGVIRVYQIHHGAGRIS